MSCVCQLKNACALHTRCSRLLSSASEFNFNDSKSSTASWNPVIAPASFLRVLSTSAIFARETATSIICTPKHDQDQNETRKSFLEIKPKDKHLAEELVAISYTSIKMDQHDICLSQVKQLIWQLSTHWNKGDIC